MTPRRIEWLIRIYGPAVASWPEEERLAALALLRRSVRLRETLAEALAREDALAACEGDGDADEGAALARMRGGLDAAIAARMVQTRITAQVASGARTTVRLGALAACAVLGVWVGSVQASGQVSRERDPLQVIASFSPASGLGVLQP
jgi:hypothetical protein